MYPMIAICEICRRYVPPGHVRPESYSEDDECPAPECPLNRARVESALRSDDDMTEAQVRQVVEYYIAVRTRRFGGRPGPSDYQTRPTPVANEHVEEGILHVLRDRAFALAADEVSPFERMQRSLDSSAISA